jgi:predicted carbohydrate-binding protein with CBM48
MTEASEHPYVEWIVSEARRAVELDPAARDRLMSLVRMEPAPRRRGMRVPTWLRPRSFVLSPAAGLAFAASLVGIGVFAGALYSHRDGRSAGTSPKAAGQPSVVAVSNPQLPVSDTVVQFIVMAPRANAVSLVGDFNGWNSAATPMRPTARPGVWSVTLPLAEGRHLYAYIVNGSQWMADPTAPIASDDGFGHKNSVILVRPGATL